MLVSVVVPTYQRFAMFVKCIESLIEQRFSPKDYEIIAVHDGENHEYDLVEIERLSRKFPRFKFLTVPKGGASAARNRAIKASSGKYILMTDDDCVADENWIVRMVRYFEDHPNISAVGGQVLAVTPKTFVETYIKDKNLLRRPVRDINGEIVTLVTANVAYRSEVLAKIGGFSNVFANNRILVGGEDLDLAFRAAKVGPLAYCEDAVVYHNHRASVRALARQHFSYGRGVFVACVNNQIDYRRVKFLRPTLANLVWRFVLSITQLLTVSIPEFRHKRIAIRRWPAYFLLDLLRRNIFMVGAAYEFYRQGGDRHEIR